MLYTKGDGALLSQPRLLTVVGSRKMTHYGEQVIEQIIPEMIEAGVVLISGFMYGVDQKVHQTCLECGGKTVAVLGWGINWEVPSADRSLYQLIEKKGLLVSEYSNSTRPQLWMFPRRDRVMAKLSAATLVIEGAASSGSLITAGFAKEFHKKLFCVPGPITSAVSEGTNNLIKSGVALMATTALDILDIMSWPHFKPPGFNERLECPSSIIAYLVNEPLSIDELARKTKQPLSQLSAELSLLQLRGQIHEINGQFYLSTHARQS